MQAIKIRPKILAPRSNGLTALEVLKLPKEQRAKILTVKQHDHVLVETDIWKSCTEGYAAWAREFEAHVQPGKRFGSAVEYMDPKSNQRWVFEVPAGPLRETKDSILLANADDCEAEVKRNRITVHVAEGKISAVENFPAKNGWYQTDQTFGIPVNFPLNDSDEAARYLYRDDIRIGPVARGDDCDYDYGGRRDVDADDRPSDRLGVLTLDSCKKTDDPEGITATIMTSTDQLKLMKRVAEGKGPELAGIGKTVKLESVEDVIRLIKRLAKQ